MKRNNKHQMRSRGCAGATGALVVTLAVMLAGAPAPAFAADIATVPLFVSTAVKPNVMIEFDNSGSMTNVIWADEYDPTVDYPRDQGRRFDQHYLFGSTSGEVLFYCRARDTDDDGRFDTVDQCLRLPAPLGDNTTRYESNYLDYLAEKYVDADTNQTVDVTALIPNSTRIEVARQVATQIVQDNDNIRFGLARFNAPHPDWPQNSDDGGSGGTIISACGASTTNLVNQIAAIPANSNTPLAETYYEITRYFRGLDSHYGDDGITANPYTSPIEYRCQKNFVIVITDGLPTYDDPNPPGNDPDTPAAGQQLPNWDGLAPETSTQQPFPQYSDGYECGSDGICSGEGSTLYLDDLAKFGYGLDLKQSGTDTLNESYEDPDFDPQRLETYTVGFAIDNQMLEDAAAYGNGEYFTANNLEELTAALQGALSSIADKTSTAAALAATSTKASSNTQIFRAKFRSGDWSGDLEAFPYNDVGFENPSWSAAEQIPAPDQRAIFTVDDSGAGIPFTSASLDSGGQGDIDSGLTALLQDLLGDLLCFLLGNCSPPPPVAADLVAYIRGSDAETQANDGPFRNRSSLLGDIVHSTPAFAGDQSYGYGVLTGDPGSAYPEHLAAKAAEPDLVLVGANDGMLHVFDAATGAERFAYVPRQLFEELAALADPEYSHRYYVDGSPAVADAYFGGGWKTVAVTTLGRGGRGAFALDLTDADALGAGSILWELSPESATPATGSADVGSYLGTAMGAPAIVRTQSGDWVAILGNGYNSSAGTAALVVVELETGAVLAVLDTGVGGDNGLGPAAAIDRDRDGSVDTVYAGDLKGNLWQFDLSGDTVDSWAIAYSGMPLASATADDGSPQPITARPDAIAHPRGGVQVVFGTGRYLGEGDVTDLSEQSVYGVWDQTGVVPAGEQPTAVAAGELVAQEIVATKVVTRFGQRSVRVISDNPVNYAPGDAQKRGWVLDLNRAGERIARDVRIFDGKAVMVSSIPAEDPCLAGGDSALIEINPLLGSQFKQPLLDLNQDGDFDQDDGITVTIDGQSVLVYPGVVDLDVGLATNPFIFNQESGNDQRKVITGSSLATESVGERGFLRPGPASWVQIR